MNRMKVIAWSTATILLFAIAAISYLNTNLEQRMSYMLDGAYILGEPAKVYTITTSHADVNLPTKEELEILATNLYREAAGEGVAGMAAVMYVVQERVNRSYWPSNHVSVVLQPNQFEWIKYSSKVSKPYLKNAIDRRAWNNAVMVAYAFLTAEEPIVIEQIKGATHYYKEGSKVPSWVKSKNMVYLGKVGKHLFFKEIKRV